MNEELLAGKLVLVVDDEEIIREIVSERFQGWGAKTIEASGGVQAHEILKNQKVDLIFTDLRMPEGDGISLITEIRNNLPYKPIIFVATGFNDTPPEHLSLMGVQHHFAKPFPYEEVESALVELFKKSAA